ncbi:MULTISPECIES: response regulator [Brevibacillus]|jgi:two-component system cell cycle response regulator|uniref:Diguanylate cyclase n=1 Tax=Brevibacillus parabrevis TaxID=54914 RepID=A0A4Y3PQB3_BREPA|nr:MULTISPECIES: response regulator [Brevibacillus]MBU8713744.1 response regulator [Brevibacillus parabrevis]MDH6350797.1 two-component system cell cycle response regulator [Brevibacillus sp. 1238]NRQ53921.1 response regulator [Brevibacillus sp. HD1.4A]RNB92573.1 response regulator [Brevibacillus parabrevis]WDV94735.1 response regulator [Brevibacillus parabrevis]
MIKYRDTLLFQIHKQLEGWLAQEEPVSHEELYRFVHSLKGTAGTIGLHDLSELSQSLLEQLDKLEAKDWPTHEWSDFLRELITLCYEHRPEQEILLEDPTLPQESTYENQPLLLILDDDVTLLMYLKEYLEKQNWSVIATVYPHKALDYFHDLNPDCLILDLNIPETGGFQVMQTLSEKIKKQYVPTTIISIDCDRDTRMRAFRLGADDVMCKPLDLEELTVRLERQLGRKRWMDKILFIDELTGAFNRNSLTDTYQRLLSDSLRNSTPFSLAFMDIDHFKKVNDTHGHLVGDVVLSRFASFIKTNSGKYDIFFRYGGEEFLLLMPRTSGQDAKLRIKQLLVDFQALSFESAEGSFSLSFSAGVVQIEDGQKPLSHWIDAADTALYAAKNNGRCRVEMAKRNDDPDTRTVRLKVAIIDDDSLTRTLLADCARASLEGWIHTDIRTFHEGAAFFESSWHQGPEAYLVILDGIMPHMDGLDVLRLIRALPNSKQYTVLMLTGRSGEQDIARALQLGADDYMTKPFSIKELEARIKRLIKRMM